MHEANDDASMLEEVQREIEGVELENNIFEAYLQRNDTGPRLEPEAGSQERLRIAQVIH
jgi:hypothetical protein